MTGFSGFFHHRQSATMGQLMSKNWRCLMAQLDRNCYLRDVVDKTPKPLTPNEIACFVRNVRRDLGWKQYALADLAGISLSSLERVERGVKVGEETYRRLAKALGQAEDAFLTPKVRRSTEDAFRETIKYLDQSFMVSVRPLRTQPQVRELLNCEFCYIDGSQVEAPVDDWVDAFKDNLGGWSFVAHESKRARKREIYAAVLGEAAEVEARGYVALAGTFKTPVLVNGETVECAFGVVSFRSRLTDPGAIKRRLLLLEKPTGTSLPIAW